MQPPIANDLPSQHNPKNPWPRVLIEALEYFRCSNHGNCTRACGNQNWKSWCYCPEHDMHFDSRQELLDHLTEEHIKKRHGETGSFECPLLNCVHPDGRLHSGIQLSNIKTHIANVLGIPLFKCRYADLEECNKTEFSNLSSCRKHEQTKHKDLYTPRSQRKTTVPKPQPGRQGGGAKTQTTKAPKKARKPSQKKAKRNEENMPDEPEAILLAHPYDDQPVAGPSSGPAFDALAQTSAGPSPAARRYNAERQAHGSTYAEHGHGLHRSYQFHEQDIPVAGPSRAAASSPPHGVARDRDVGAEPAQARGRRSRYQPYGAQPLRRSSRLRRAQQPEEVPYHHQRSYDEEYQELLQDPVYQEPVYQEPLYQQPYQEQYQELYHEPYPQPLNTADLGLHPQYYHHAPQHEYQFVDENDIVYAAQPNNEDAQDHYGGADPFIDPLLELPQHIPPPPPYSREPEGGQQFFNGVPVPQPRSPTPEPDVPVPDVEEGDLNGLEGYAWPEDQFQAGLDAYDGGALEHPASP